MPQEIPVIPSTLAGWTLPVVENLVHRALFEPEHFEYKEQLPNSKDDGAKRRLRKACCAFANSDGGFLIFGVHDDRKKNPEDRLLGIDQSIKFQEQFGNFPGECSPSISWDFNPEGLKLPSGKLLHVVHIPKSWNGPHACGSKDGGWDFAKRSNKGDEGMAIDEIRGAFLGLYEKRLKLQLMRTELVTLAEKSEKAVVPHSDAHSQYWLLTFDTRVIESVLADTYTVTAGRPELISALSEVRRAADVANTKLGIFFGVVELPLTNKAEILRAHNEFMRTAGTHLANKCKTAIAELDRLLATA
jgi:hypothetical protein